MFFECIVNTNCLNGERQNLLTVRIRSVDSCELWTEAAAWQWLTGPSKTTAVTLTRRLRSIQCSLTLHLRFSRSFTIRIVAFLKITHTLHAMIRWVIACQRTGISSFIRPYWLSDAALKALVNICHFSSGSQLDIRRFHLFDTCLDNILYRGNNVFQRAKSHIFVSF